MVFWLHQTVVYICSVESFACVCVQSYTYLVWYSTFSFRYLAEKWIRVKISSGQSGMATQSRLVDIERVVSEFYDCGEGWVGLSAARCSQI